MSLCAEQEQSDKFFSIQVVQLLEAHIYSDDRTIEKRVLAGARMWELVPQPSPFSHTMVSLIR